MAREDGMKTDQDKNLDKVTNQTWYNTKDILLLNEYLTTQNLQKVTEAGNTTNIPLIVKEFPDAATMAFTHLTVANLLTSIGTSLTKDAIIYTNLTNTITVGFVPPTSPRTQVYQDDDGVIALTKNLIPSATIQVSTDHSTIGGERVGVDASAGPVIITLPAAGTCDGNTIDIAKVDSTTNLVIINSINGELINGLITGSLTTQWDNLTLLSFGSYWVIK